MHASAPAPLIPLERETRTHLTTTEAAPHLRRHPMTLYRWSNSGTGPIQPVRVNGRLLWEVARIRAALGVQ